MENKYKVTVATNYFGDGDIETKVTNLAGEVSRFVISTREEQTRQALIGLGWTPPAKE